MITRVWFENSNRDFMNLDLFDFAKSGYAVREITGLSAGEADLKMTQLASGNRFVYNKGFRKIRDLDIMLQYMNYNDENKSIQQLREDILSLLKVNDRVKFAIITDKADIYYIEGYVASHVADTFSQECQSKIKIQCPDIFFVDGESYDEETRYRAKTYTLALPNGTQMVYRGTVFANPIITFGNPPSSDSDDLYGDFTVKFENDETSIMKISIPHESGFRYFTADFTSDIPQFKIHTVDDVIDAAKYVKYRELVGQSVLPTIAPGLNVVTITYENTPFTYSNPSYNKVDYTVRYLGV